MGMLLHCGGVHATRAELAAVPVPAQTDSYYPVEHAELAELVKQATAQIGEIREEEYALNRDGAHAFGVLCVDMGSAERQLTVGWRNSYDKSLAVGIGSGDRMLVCDNLAFTGSGYTALRRHTRNAWPDIERMVDEATQTARVVWQDTEQLYAAMREIPVDQREGYRLIGEALGERVLTPTQSNRMLGDWRNARHAVFEPRNAFSLYNCMTEGLKKGAASGLMLRSINATRWFVDRLDVEPCA